MSFSNSLSVMQLASLRDGQLSSALFLVSLCFQLTLILLFPMIYGGDTVTRLLHREELLHWHWLPGTQFLIYIFFSLTKSIIGTRILFAATVGTLTYAFYDYLRLFQQRRTAFFNCLFFLLNPLFVFVAIVPYQEGILLLFVLLTFTALARERYWGAGLLYSIACLVRYEAWLLSPFLIYYLLKKEQPPTRLPSLLVQLIPFTCGGIAWLLINYRMWNDPLHFLHIYHFSTNSQINNSWMGLFYPLWWLVKYGTPLMVLAVVGMYRQWQPTVLGQPLVRIYAGWIALLFLTQPFYIPDYVTNQRQAFKIIALLSIFTAAGIDVIIPRLRRQLWLSSITALLIAYTTFYIYWVANKEVVVETYHLAQTLDELAAANEQIIVLSAGFPQFPTAEPAPYIRIGGQSNRGRQLLISAHSMEVNSAAELDHYIAERNVCYLLQYADYEPWDRQDRLCFAKIETCRGIIRSRQLGRATLYELIH